MSEHANPLQTDGQCGLSRIRSVFAALLRMYAGIFFADSLATGALLLGATALAPYAALLGLLAVSCAVGTAHVLGLVSAATPPSTYAYSALFLGLGAGSVFARPTVSLAFAVLGGAASAVLTAGMRGFLLRVALSPLSLPFVLVYLCAISAGILLGADWALVAPAAVPEWFACLPPPVRAFPEALGAILFIPRVEVGLIVFVALCASGWRAPLLACLGFVIAMLVDRGLSLPPPVRSAAMFNAMFASMGLGMTWCSPGFTAYLRAAGGAFLCIVLTIALDKPMGRIWLTPVSIPFNLSIFSVLLIDRQRAWLRPSGLSRPIAAAATLISHAKE